MFMLVIREVIFPFNLKVPEAQLYGGLLVWSQTLVGWVSAGFAVSSSSISVSTFFSLHCCFIYEEKQEIDLKITLWASGNNIFLLIEPNSGTMIFG